jgi:carboxypeptidase C (cathepsin A)
MQDLRLPGGRFAAPLYAAEESAGPPAPPAPAPAATPIPEPVTTEHKIELGGKKLRYFVTVGMLPIKNEEGVVEANLFYTAYSLGSKDGDKKRPLTFTFNGGPGSSSVWLHLGGLAPKRVQMLDDGAMPAPPFKLIDNEFNWLEKTDLVFIDPVDTGYSRALNSELAKKFKSVKGDLDAMAEFIRLYLTRAKRWTSPLFLAGESYGTFRAAGLSGLLIEKGVAFNGIILVSSVLDMLTLHFHPGNDLPYMVYVPTYAATAWRHGRLPAKLQSRDLKDVLSEAEGWAAGEYAAALAKGSALIGDERANIAEKLARFTGLSKAFVERSNLRIEIQNFCKELLRDEGRTVGRLDSRYTGFDVSGVTAKPDFDPAMTAIRPPFTAALNDHLRNLGWETDAEYHILRGLEWDWGASREGYARTTEAIESAFAKNPYLHLFIASGYYDLATPFFATDYTVRHLAIAPETRANISTNEYAVGHMVYLESTVLAKLQADVAAFIDKALAAPGIALRS